jgi:hypothetical protein
MMPPRHASLAIVAVAALALVSIPARGQSPTGISARATISPWRARVGEPVRYQGRTIVSFPLPVQLLPPDADPDVTWSPLSVRVLPGRGDERVGNRARLPSSLPIDTLLVEGEAQVFRTGRVPIAGVRFQAGNQVYRLPGVVLDVVSVLTPADSNADLRPARGPLGAPWWERVPWLRVIAIALLIAVIVIVWLRWRRRRRSKAPIIASPVRDPVAEALASLTALRGLNLPAHGRFAEHAFHLTLILRRFLEATAGVTRPGDTTPELLAHLGASTLASDDVTRLDSLLRQWDRVKFAREASSIEDARRAEIAVETLVRRNAPPPEAKVA